MSARRRVVLLTSDGPEHARVARSLAAAGALDAVVVAHDVPRSRRRRLRTGIRRFGALGLAQRLGWRALRTASGAAARDHRALTAVLGHPDMPAGIAVHETVGVNTERTRALLRELGPDVLCVYGTAIVKDDTLAIARGEALNLHTGISPRYRGADCAFWPLHEGEPEWLGATVHECTSAIDGGAVYGTARAHLEADDGVPEAFARCVIAGADLYADVVSRLARGETVATTVQDLSAGREYRASMRTWRAELRVRRALRGGLVRAYVAAGRPGPYVPVSVRNDHG